MKKTRFLLLGLLAASWGYGQSLSPEVVATAGDYFTNANAQLSWTMGEPVIGTYASGTAQLTPGFHQTNLTIVAVNDPPTDLQVRVYPNPTAGWVNMEAQASTPAFSLEVSDAQGQVLLWQPATPPAALRSLDLSAYAPGVYYLCLCAEDQKSTQTCKIIKHD